MKCFFHLFLTNSVLIQVHLAKICIIYPAWKGYFIAIWICTKFHFLCGLFNLTAILSFFPFLVGKWGRVRWKEKSQNYIFITQFLGHSRIVKGTPLWNFYSDYCCTSVIYSCSFWLQLMIIFCVKICWEALFLTCLHFSPR